MIYRYFLITVSLIGIAVALWIQRPPDVLGLSPDPSLGDKPRPGVKFSHRFHTAGLTCTDCHVRGTESMDAKEILWADHNACTTCHQEQLDSDCSYCHLDAGNIQTVTPAERTLIFPHGLHTEVECLACHAGIDSMEDFSQSAFPSMETCYSCHNNEVASNTCESCHIDFVSLYPDEHRRSDFLRTHRETIRLGGLEQSCQTCHEETFCQECHQGVELKAFGTGELRSDPRAKISVRDNEQQMTLEFAHELNYRFFHGIDAKARQSECMTCHEAQTFCAECHEAGGNINQDRFKPASHGIPGFTTLGRGSGGGLHAEDARRDIENCLSCHDLEGQDPTCLVCHTDGGSVR